MSPDQKEIEELLTRSISYIFPSREELSSYLLGGKKLKIYLGVDATGPELHIGHATNLIFLEKLRRFGHDIVLLFGDFTARIGDPTDKGATRTRLTEEEVLRNIKDWKSQAQKILDFSARDNPAQILQNSAWLGKLSLPDVVELASSITVQQMLERDMFQKRIEERKPIYLHEFLYPLLQGYDSVAMDVTAEVGGNDQIFNMFVGRELQKRYHNKEKFVIATTLLENPKTGKKLMSKSEGSYIALSDAPSLMYGKAMALPDEVIVSVFTDCTFLPLETIGAYAQMLHEGANPRDIKMKLARELVKTYHSEGEVQTAERAFVSAFQKKETPDEVQEVTAEKGDFLGKVLLLHGVVASNADFRRLVKEGAVRDIDAGTKIDDHTALVEHTAVFKIGKKRFVRIVVR
ncbi:MAG: tyrosine--tRNA ligase [Candidatus Lloydbacteria bacterium RIFCSPHIGHO2_02_FULL_51_22]|uniref:Tyrosine--tRNA ligase n=1 Tax=Candidatus Lloydbacteria bacterium RIFCSPHIGHO2_02_FULL_51_22 TaxID=1798663 RepID=A0A1G2DB80_9BACT|nr:MAG: tyrosine--tRNA ligase [Candidatus Lloydbacteria bacterium RIFCSPHIGHO2_02_FULL_51_22]